MVNICMKTLREMMDLVESAQTVDEGEVVPFRRLPAQASWQKLPKDILQLANDWFWANEEDSGLQAVTDPGGYGQGTANDIKYVQAKLQSKGWTIDYDDEIDNIVLTNRQGQTVTLPVNDAYDATGWATGTLDENEEVEEDASPDAVARILELSKDK